MSGAHRGERGGCSRSRRAGQTAGQEVWRPGSDDCDQDPLPDPTQTLSQELPGYLTPLPSEFSVFVSTGQDHWRRKCQSGSQQSLDDGRPSTPFTRVDKRFHRASGHSRSTQTDSSPGVMSASCQVPVEPSETSNSRTAQGAVEKASPVKKSSTEKPTECRKRKGIGSFFRRLRKAMNSAFGCCGHSSAVDVVEPFVPPADLEPEPDLKPSPAPDHSAVKMSNDQKSLQSISSSAELIDFEEPPVNVIEVLPTAEPLVQEELQTQVHDAPASQSPDSR